jgi:sulfoxide reductase heme-binding subunit YedZ
MRIEKWNWKICSSIAGLSYLENGPFKMKDTKFPKLLLFINALVPLALMLWDVYHKRVGANPLEFVTRTTGMLTLVFLMLTLAVTPVRTIIRLNWLVKFRRMFGLFAFFYGFLHLLTYLWFDRYFNLKSVPGDVVSRPFIAIGMTAFILMAPLAITSTNKMVKRLGGKRWSRLHQLIYGAGIAGVVHFWMLVKSDTRLPMTFAFVLALLLAFRMLAKYSPPTPKGFTGSVIPPR